MKGLIILAHGSKVKEIDETLTQIVNTVRNMIDFDFVEKSYLRMMAPNLEESFDKLYKEGVRNFIVFPYFLFSGQHIISDIPKKLDELKEEYPDANINYLDSIGFDKKMAELIVERVQG